MTNMSYCRFHNTVLNLRDCYEHIHDELPKDQDNYGDDEHSARQQLLKLCARILEECSNVRVEIEGKEIEINEYDENEEEEGC